MLSCKCIPRTSAKATRLAMALLTCYAHYWGTLGSARASDTPPDELVAAYMSTGIVDGATYRVAGPQSVMSVSYWPREQALTYRILVPSRRIYAENVFSDCNTIGRRFLELNPLGLRDGMVERRWFEVQPCISDTWGLYGSNVTPASLKYVMPRGSPVYVFAGKVWSECDFEWPPYGQFVARGQSKQLAGVGKLGLRASVSLLPSMVRVGQSITATVTITNESSADVVIPDFVPNPICLAAVNGERNEVTSLGMPPPNPLTHTHLLLRQGRSMKRVLNVRIGSTSSIGSVAAGCHLDVKAGTYAISLFDLKRYGYPTTCKPATLTVEETFAPRSSE